MNNLNSIIIEGNLTRDPDYKTTPKGTPVCTFPVASNRFYKKDDEQQKEVSFFNVETWAKIADSCSEYLSKGRGVRVVGRLKQDRWVGQDGKNRERVKIVAEHVEFKPVFMKNGKSGDSSAQVASDDKQEEGEENRVAEAAAEEEAKLAVPPEDKEEDDDLLEAV